MNSEARGKKTVTNFNVIFHVVFPNSFEMFAFSKSNMTWTK